METTTLLCIVYVSSARTVLKSEELDRILASARKNNAQMQITGMLLYSEGNFIQAIEGPAETVRSLYAKIANDPRHRGVIKLLEESVTERSFPEWSMGYRSCSRQELPDGFTEVLDNYGADDLLSQLEGHASKLLRTFRDSALKLIVR